ncbi:MAG: DEAD/DEAH box helicase, partial [Deltaproteobacteria bacterium]|nr:DEAD/DEAH box helicase [Deltaproteobacteria bacterium]
AEQFRQRFALPVERDRDPGRRGALSALIRPFVLRRVKEEVAKELPPRTEVEVPVSLSREERELYEGLRLAAVSELQASAAGPAQRRLQALTALTRLRQAACHPRLVDEASAVTSSKLSRLRELVAELREEGHRALVFSQFVRHLALVREVLEEEGVSYRYLDGSTPERARRREVDAFQDGDGDVFLISLRAGGTGLNLTAATYVIHLDPWWNPAVEDQATDRTHRIGQTKPVTVYRLVTRNTIEESILALHDHKRSLVAGVLAGTAEAATLGVDEIMELLGA